MKILILILGEKLGIVMQENFFKNDTISSNIALGRKIDRKK